MVNSKTHCLVALIALAGVSAAPLYAGSAATTIPAAVTEAPRVLGMDAAGVGRLVPDLEVAPLQGVPFRLSDRRPAAAVVIAFLSSSCPVSKRYAPTLAGLEKTWSVRGVRFVFVDPIASDSAAEISALSQAHGLQGALTRDADGRWRAALGARATTEVFVLDAARTLVYRGAVDDQYGLGYSREQPSQAYLADALTAVVAGKVPTIRVTSAPGCALEPVRAAASAAVPVTYHNRISRLVQQHCLECHRPDGVAPFALAGYDEVVAHAGMIRKVLDRGIMPPWFAAPGHPGAPSPWANDRSLAAEDRQDWLAWLAAGKPEGDGRDAPLARSFPPDWDIGTPDAVIPIPEPIAVKATGKMPYQNVIVETTFAEDRWVEALEVRPTARDVVHHVLVFVIPKENQEAAVKNARRGRDSNGGDFFAVYVPGNNVLRYPPGFAKFLPAGAKLHFQIHYTPTGLAKTDRTRLGLIFAKQPPQHEVRVASLINPTFRIPPGDPNYEVQAQLPVVLDARILSFMPHMHVRGKAFRYELKSPEGVTTRLLEVPRYDFNWQLQYTLREPLEVAAGSQLRGTAWFDNSTNNPANPDPAREVTWGPQTDDEMMLGYFEYYALSQKPGERISVAGLAMRDASFRGTFNHLDKNQDGKISPDESPTQEAFQQADENHDGVVTFEEFKRYMRGR